jgi:hypothetical protein
VGRIGLLGEQSGRALETQSRIMKNLQDMRQSVAGVNMDPDTITRARNILYALLKQTGISEERIETRYYNDMLKELLP